MDSNSTSKRSDLLKQLNTVIKASVGGMVVASATLAATPAQASVSVKSGNGRPAVKERVEEIRKQIGSATVEKAPSEEGGPLYAWGNWHNWRNGWPNGWHNWHNWGNWGN